MKNKITMIIIFISFILPVSAEEGQMLPVCTNGCHTERGISYGITEENWCGSCHQYVSKSVINIPAMEENHNPKTCSLCHNVGEPSTFHTLHVNVTGSCNRCHGESGSAKPDKSFNNCAGCHGGRIHNIHEENLGELCTTCHGKTPQNPPENPIAGFQAANKLYTKVIDYQQYTLLELIKSLLGWK